MELESVLILLKCEIIYVILYVERTLSYVLINNIKIIKEINIEII